MKSDERNDKEEFVRSVMKSPYVEYHHSLLKDKDLDEKFRRHLWNRFDEHRKKGAELLLSKLDNNKDTEFHAYRIPSMIYQFQRQDTPKPDKEIAVNASTLSDFY